MGKTVLFSTSTREASLMDFLDQKSRDLRMSKSSIIKYGIRKLCKQVRTTGEVVFKIDTTLKQTSGKGQEFSYTLGQNDSDIEEFLIEMQQAGLNRGLISKVAIRLLIEEDNMSNSIDLISSNTVSVEKENNISLKQNEEETYQEISADKIVSEDDTEEVVITDEMRSSILNGGILAK